MADSIHSLPLKLDTGIDQGSAVIRPETAELPLAGEHPHRIMDLEGQGLGIIRPAGSGLKTLEYPCLPYTSLVDFVRIGPSRGDCKGLFFLTHRTHR